MEKPVSETYARRLMRVSAYIHDHLDKELSLDVLADVACLSPYHWHRIYHGYFGETVAATVRRLRLQRAAAELAHTGKSIQAIAMRAGYDSQASFTRAFSAAFGLPPAKYREVGSHSVFKDSTLQDIQAMYDIALNHVPAMDLIAVDHRGSYMSIGKSFDLLFTTLASRNLIKPDMRMIGVYIDDPTSVPEAELRSQAGVAVFNPVAVDAPLLTTQVQGGDYAVLKYKGPYGDMRMAYDWLFGQWLPASNREAADAPVFEDYLNSPRDTPPTELRTDIYLPLR
ncbi:AraC family transcriptional regulator [Microvirga guangxiensis]|uniref:AraC family transcriptional regulator n=1 Tax=Microvirga guangxiensis TaxID=549386 RepID=A0A1G5G1H0_9HYPH|nr:AraC family transcriptional regulator [Microvirga guangxiensis]SCY45412.1 AraC family transcriptional regulator [Microvirga guangxiensis]